MIGFSLISGTASALIVDHLDEEGRGDEYLKVISTLRSKGYFIAMLTSVVSGYLYAINPRLPFMLSIPGVIFSFFILFFIKEKKRKSRASSKEHFELIKLSFIFLANNKKLKWIVGFFMLISVSSKIWFFTFNPYFEVVELSPEYYGLIFAALNGGAWLISRKAHKIYEKIGEFYTLFITVVFMGIPLVILAIFPSKIMLILLIFSSFSRSMTTTLSSSMKNHYLSSENRATVLSIGSSLNGAVGAISLFLFGLVLSKHSLEGSMFGLGILVLLLGIFALRKYKKIFS